jgi:hypothetical protein
MVSNYIPPNYNSPNQRFLDDILTLQSPGATPKILQPAQQLGLNTYDNDNFSPVYDINGNTYAGIPQGGWATDIDIGKDLDFKYQAIQSQREYLRQLYSFLVTNDYRGVSQLLQQIVGTDPNLADQLGLQLFNNLQKSTPLLLASIENLDKRLSSTQENLRTQKDLNQANKRTYDQKIGEIVKSFGQGG